MKTRNDFVSNSSSSSFICTYEDLDNISYRGERSTLDLRAYCEHYALDDVFGRWRWLDGISKRSMKFVDDNELQDSFSSSIYYMLPTSAKKAFDDYLAIDNDKSADYNVRRSKRDAAEKAIADKIYDALAPKWKDVKFACIDASDDNGDEQYMEDAFWGGPSKKFARVFNNH